MGGPNTRIKNPRWRTLAILNKSNKSSAVAEMGDRGHKQHRPKTGGRAPFRRGELGPHLTQRRWAEAYLRTKWHLDPSSRLATIDMGRKLGAPPLLGKVQLGPI